MSKKGAVLVVDDNKLFQGLMVDLLSDDYTVLRAERIQDGYCLFQENRDDISVILIDGTMPLGPSEMPRTMDLVRRIRDEGFSGVIVAISSEESLQEELCKAGCNVELRKPFSSLTALLEVLRA